jgi:hypothetical protein
MLKKRLLSRSREYPMTLPDERYRSLVQTKKFLMELMSPHMTPRVPKDIRNQARWLLRHWPDDYHLEMMTIDMPNHFAKQMEPLTRMIMVYDQEQKEEQNDKTI